MKTIIALILILIGIAFIFMFSKPLWIEISALRIQKQEIESTVSEFQRLQSARDGLLSTYNSISKNDLEKLEKILPNNSDNSGILIFLEKTAKDRGISLRRIEFQPKSIVASRGIENIVSNFETLNFSITLSANYNSFKSFLSALERGSRVIDITDLSFFSGKTDFFEFVLRGKSYYQKKDEINISNAIKEIGSIKLDTSFFSDPQFLDLEVLPSPPPEIKSQGRINPFLPF